MSVLFIVLRGILYNFETKKAFSTTLTSVAPYLYFEVPHATIAPTSPVSSS